MDRKPRRRKLVKNSKLPLTNRRYVAVESTMYLLTNHCLPNKKLNSSYVAFFKTIFSQVKKEKKPKIDKSNPNWKLKSRPEIKVWMDDPLFQSNEDVPYVSSLSHSHLITRAVMMNDMKSLKKCIDDRKMISRINPRRSLAVPYGN